MATSIFDTMQLPLNSSSKLLAVLQDQQMDNMQTSMAVFSCRDMPALLALQKGYMQRAMDRWAKLSGTPVPAPFMPQVRQVMESIEGKLAMAEKFAPKTAPVVEKAAKAEPVQDAAIAPMTPSVVATTPMATVRTVHAEVSRTDDLTAIKGIGPKFAQTLQDHGIKTFKDLADLTPAEVTDLEEKLGFSGRFAREGWVEQAKSLIN